jgi:N-acetyl sugar amidotransferase
MNNTDAEKMLTVCKRCIFDSSVPEITFDRDGVCSYCYQVDSLISQYKTGTPDGTREIERIVAEIKRNGRNKKYDCIVGVSGGVDSSYMLHWAVINGLRPLAVHYDNTWNSEIATMNIARVTKKLNVDLYTYVVNNREIDSIYRAFLAAGVPAIDVVTDLGFTEVLYRAAKTQGVRYVLEGHSFIEEGVSPVGYSYFDGKYIEDVCRKNGFCRFETYPLMRFSDFMKWTLIYRIKKIRPYWYINYSKKQAAELLGALYGWRSYGGHHLENRITAFSYSFHNPVKFGMDQRNNMLSALARNGALSHGEALDAYRKGPRYDSELVEYVIKRLDYSVEGFREVMQSENKTWADFKSNKKLFERLRFLFYAMAKANLVPMSFYLKYCLPMKARL